MKTSNIIILKIYLKNRKRPIKFQMPETELKVFYNDLETKDLIVIGSLSFYKSEYKYGIVNE